MYCYPTEDSLQGQDVQTKLEKRISDFEP